MTGEEVQARLLHPSAQGDYSVRRHPSVPGFWMVVNRDGFVVRNRTRRAFFKDLQAAVDFARIRNRQR